MKMTSEDFKAIIWAEFGVILLVIVLVIDIYHGVNLLGPLGGACLTLYV